MKARKLHLSTGSLPKACTLWTMPERVRNVASMVSRKLVRSRNTFHTFSMPRRSCTITECRKAVGGEPGQRAGVLDGVPAPVAAPA